MPEVNRMSVKYHDNMPTEDIWFHKPDGIDNLPLQPRQVMEIERDEEVEANDTEAAEDQ